MSCEGCGLLRFLVTARYDNDSLSLRFGGNYCLLKLLWAGINRAVHRYGPNNTYPCVFNMKRRTFPYLLFDFYNASQFEMINFANVKIDHFNSDPVISLFGNMQIPSIYEK